MSYLALKTFTNEALFEEVTHRLKRLHRDMTGREFQFGEIALIFRDGKLQGIEERSKNRLFCPKNSPDQHERSLKPA
jgi:hypothetical protein